MPEPAKIRCLVVDDEPPAREIIRRYIEQVPLLELIGDCANAIQAFGFLQQHEADLIFLDIRMPQLNGNDFLKALKNPPKVILTTAFSEYALEGYELDVVDFLMKPISFDRFLRAVNKACHLSIHRPDSAAVPEGNKSDSFVYFRADRKMVKVMLKDILYIESMKDYIRIITNNGTIITKQSISSVEEMLPDKEFVRSHRSFIVATRHIKSYTSEIIEIHNTEIPIGKLFRNEVLKVLT
ncbi:MAG TPA: LytTR family DNA-binding domain-containing protein [Chitinophagaceae bacterium]|nr:LytTR family DNA-binding domain-containing protein [Chitinophagaceae bacterium]